MLSQASKVTGIGLLALACGALVVPACGSGGSDDEPTAGKGGSGTGRSAGSGIGGNSAGSATGGTGGATGGSGGNTTQVVTACPGVMPGGSLIADFDAGATEGKYEWGSADQGTMDFWGGTFSYPAALEVTFADGPRPLVKYPGKRPMIRVHTRPPHLETPFGVFNEGPITPKPEKVTPKKRRAPRSAKPKPKKPSGGGGEGGGPKPGSPVPKVPLVRA